LEVSLSPPPGMGGCNATTPTIFAVVFGGWWDGEKVENRMGYG
jgi:hypothetical protein